MQYGRARLKQKSIGAGWGADAGGGQVEQREGDAGAEYEAANILTEVKKPSNTGEKD